MTPDEREAIEQEMGRRGWFISTYDDTDDCADPDDNGETTAAIERGELERLTVVLRAEDGRWIDTLGSVIVEPDPGGWDYVKEVGAEMAADVIATHRECGARTTCGNCGNAWCGRCDPAATSWGCHWCHGRGSSTAPMDAPTMGEVTA